MAEDDPDAFFLGHAGQKILFMKDGKVLMCKGAKGFLQGLWDFPGGRMHKNEQPKEALKRELKEELGVDFEIGKPIHVSVTYNTPLNIPRYYVVFESTLVNPNAEFIVAADEISELKWVAPEEVADLPTWEDWRVLLTEYFKTH